MAPSAALAVIIHNPLKNHLFWPSVIRVAALLVAGVLIVALVERKPLAQLRQSVLFKRIFSWSAMAPTFLAAIFFGGVVGLVVIAYLVIQGLAEYIRLVRIGRRYAWLLIVSGLLTLVLTGLLPRYFLFAPLAFFILVTLIPIASGDVEGAHYQVTSSLFGYLYIPFFLAYLVFIRVVEPDGVQMLLFIGVAVALSDVLAFVVGSLLKGPKLASKVSPHKTWSGVGGNLAGAYGGLALMWFALPREWSGVTLVVAPLAVAFAAVWGDLMESFIKRDFGVKDAGDLLPGFGGLLDRIDSLLIALPLAYYAILISEHFTTIRGSV
jgi:phosphatidate cytidylyltransferase